MPRIFQFFTLVTESFSKYSECEQLHKDATPTIEEKFNDNSFCSDQVKSSPQKEFVTCALFTRKNNRKKIKMPDNYCLIYGNFFYPSWLSQSVKKFTFWIKAIAFLEDSVFFWFVRKSEFAVLESMSWIFLHYFILPLGFFYFGLMISDFYTSCLSCLLKTGFELFHCPYCFGCLTNSVS